MTDTPSVPMSRWQAFREFTGKVAAALGDVVGALNQLAILLQQAPQHQVALTQQARLQALLAADVAAKGVVNSRGQ